MNLQRLLCPRWIAVLAILIGMKMAGCVEITYKMLAKGCESRCNNMFPRPISGPNNPPAPSKIEYLDYDDVKKFSCLEACRMAVTAYPKSDDEIRRYDIINKSKSD
ncbi:hypothetical protein BBOV_III006832 [Babesia bovis T2Bo]|uniref:hypothetical protein n=1 Tax=Babesia bovis T2Bo TaxID=484906 RepID=UPI001C364352|nr:hypothetical protein BBOV_III006832 [Babesia bovis T2Bo]KAG6440050.1 hypothetical protein BBOV_III006832 [Babesia bovis T2Bo]